MIAVLLESPRTPEQWLRWSYHHRDSHTRIRQAIQKQKNVNLVEYQLDPIFDQDLQGFLQRNSQSHGDMLSILGIQSEDLLDVDFKDERQAQAWIQLHYYDHFNAETALGI
jgi:hypothetical protein